MRAASIEAPGESPVPHGSAGPGFAHRLTRILRAAVELPVALLVVAEILVLFAGVVARYALHAPLVWSDELASILFLWLAMLGSVLALERDEHMRMTALVNKRSGLARARMEALVVLACLAFVATLGWPALEYAMDEAAITTPALGISNAWRAAAVPTGLALLGVFALLKLARGGTRGWLLAGIAVVAATAVAVVAMGPVMRDLGNANLLIFFVAGVGILVALGVPIAFSFALATVSYLALTTQTPVTVMIGRIDEGMSHIILLSVPLFVFLGLLLEMTGMARAMVAFLASLLGHVRGGLSYVLVGAMYLVSGISGSKAADMAAVAPVLFPEMKERGAKSGDLVALLSATGAQTETIPPSLVLITIGSVTGVSIAALFTGGMVPGLVLGLILVAMVWWRHRGDAGGTAPKAGKREVGRMFLVALPAIALPFIIRAAVVEGVATATEVSTIGIAYCVLAGLFVYRKFDVKRLRPMLLDTASLSGAILLIIGCATAMGWALTQSGFSRSLAEAMSHMPGGKFAFLAVSILAFTLLGAVLEGIPAIVLFGPLLFPIARQFGVHEVHYSMVVVLSMGLGLFAPPFGVGYYAACAIGRVSPDEAVRPIWGYLAALLIGVVVIAALPVLSIGFL